MKEKIKAWWIINAGVPDLILFFKHNNDHLTLDQNNFHILWKKVKSITTAHPLRQSHWGQGLRLWSMCGFVMLNTQSRSGKGQLMDRLFLFIATLIPSVAHLENPFLPCFDNLPSTSHTANLVNVRNGPLFIKWNETVLFSPCGNSLEKYWEKIKPSVFVEHFLLPLVEKTDIPAPNLTRLVELVERSNRNTEAWYY